MPLTMGKREYSDAELQRMQRDAEDRVREMQERTRQASAKENGAATSGGGNRNWNHWSGARRIINRTPGYQQEQHRAYRQEQEQAHAPPTAPAPPPPPPPTQQTRQQRQQQPPQRQQYRQHHQRQQTNPQPQPQGPRPTLIEELMLALNLDDDYLLILGLMLILINQRADTTMILALAYLLI